VKKKINKFQLVLDGKYTLYLDKKTYANVIGELKLIFLVTQMIHDLEVSGHDGLNVGNVHIIRMEDDK
jgi:hypothetical protein